LPFVSGCPVFERDARVAPRERDDAAVGVRSGTERGANALRLTEPEAAGEKRGLAGDEVLADDVALEIEVSGREFIAVRFEEGPAAVGRDAALKGDPGRNTAGRRLRSAVRPLSVRGDGRQEGERDCAQEILVL
jgi:hypothetical protein